MKSQAPEYPKKSGGGCHPKFASAGLSCPFFCILVFFLCNIKWTQFHLFFFNLPMFLVVLLFLLFMPSFHCKSILSQGHNPSQERPNKGAPPRRATTKKNAPPHSDDAPKENQQKTTPVTPGGGQNSSLCFHVGGGFMCESNRHMESLQAALPEPWTWVFVLVLCQLYSHTSAVI